MLHLKKVHHIAIICSDYPKSLTFYTDILGFRILAEHYRSERQSYRTELAFGNEYVIELFSFPAPPARLSYPEAAGLRHLAFEVEDLSSEIEELDRLGIAHEPVRTNEDSGKRFLFLKDPDGLPIELCEQ